jgi:hypothetical protein
MNGTPCVVSVAEHAGWANLVAVAAVGGAPAVVDRRRVVTIGDGVPSMPYHHESLGMAERDANALIEQVRRSIAAHTLDSLRATMGDLAPAYAAVALAIRKPPFPGLPDTVADVRRSYPLQCAADGMMYQLAMCRAARELGLGVYEVKRGAESAEAAETLGLTVADVDAFVGGTGRPPGPPWTAEHRRAFAAGIAALRTHVREHP